MEYPENPTLECDIVMKGGLTSGVIYPRAVCKLATTYRLRSVGGSSAGAIAAAGAAAAELGRTTGGFELLETLPRDITDQSPAGGSVLYRLFQPTEQTYPLYRALTAGMGISAKSPDGTAGSGKNTAGRRKIAKTLRIFVALLTGFWQWGLAGAALGVVLVVVSVFGRGPAVVAGLLGGLILVLLGAAVGIAYGAIRVVAGMAGTGFGMCTGRAGHRAKGAKALTPFLHERLQAMAGRPDGPVLTFGDLAAAGIELRMMTTNLTRRQPMPMPWTMQEYFFEPAEMRALFPDDVVEWMEAHPPTVGADGKLLSPNEARKRDLLRAQAKTKRPWPAPDDVPVIVATRMSLSFPVLITAVPLYAVNYALAVNRDASEAADRWLAAHPNRPAAEGASEVAVEPQFDANWFSDGGVCANLPVHFFDAPLPTRPTFAIDLEDFPPDRTKSPNQSENCYLPLENNARLLRPWTTLSGSGVKTGSGARTVSNATTVSGIKALGSFLYQIVTTARGWLDAAELVTPGYRDRVVTIYCAQDAGGGNLAMPVDIVTGLAARGEAAAAKLVEKFAGDPEGRPQGWGWNNQRWIRFRTATAGLNSWLTRLQTNYNAAAPGALPYADLAGPNASAPLPSYGFSSKVDGRAAVNDLTFALLAFATTWGTDNALSDNAPRPRPQLRLVPDDGAATSRAQRPADMLTEDQAPQG